MQTKWTQLSYWKDKQATMAAIVSLATYIYNGLLTNPNSVLSFSRSDNANYPIVQVSTGAVRGIYERSRDGSLFASFYGIKYAKDPINELRFRPPLEEEPWTGIRDCTGHSPECLQIEGMVTGRVQGVESCLTLNLFSPAHALNVSTDKQLLPVMVFFHGGLFISGGSQMYGPKYFMDQGMDVLLIVVQYRLGALGFLSSGDEVVPGNIGLLDQNLALQWIQKNVESFGGAKSSVTLFGNSAGGSSVQFHMLSPFSKGLFHKGISESGTAIKIWTLNKNPKAQFHDFATRFGCLRSNSHDTVECLRNIDGRDLVKTHLSTMSAIRDNQDLFVPTVDGKFIPDKPIEMLRNGSFHQIPWLVGVNSGDGKLNTARILADEHIYKNLNKEWNSWIPRMLDYDFTRKDVSEKIKNRYFGKFKGKYFAEDVTNITRLYSDRVYFHATQKAAMLHAKHAPTFLYYYTYPGDYSFFSLFKGVMPRHEDKIAPELKIAFDVAKDLFKKYILRTSDTDESPCHADELLLLFNMHRAVEVTKRSRDYQMSKNLVKVWTDFAKLRDFSNFAYQDVHWISINATHNNKVQYMELNTKGKLIPNLFDNVMQFWDSLNIE